MDVKILIKSDSYGACAQLRHSKSRESISTNGNFPPLETGNPRGVSQPTSYREVLSSGFVPFSWRHKN